MSERIFYATHNVTLGGSALKGVQSVSLSSNFGLEPVFQLGQCNQVEVAPSVPQCEVTIRRSILGGPAISLDLTNDCTSAEEILNAQQDIVIGSDAGGFTVGNAYLSGYTVNFSTEGVFTEEISYVGDSVTSGGGFSALNDKVHLPRRQDWTGPAGATSASMKLQIDREPLFVLGQYKPLKRFVKFPVVVTMDIGYLLPAGGSLGLQDPPNCAVWEDGKTSFTIGACGATWEIREAYLSNIGYSGGDVGGGNVEVKYTYTSWSDCQIG